MQVEARIEPLVSCVMVTRPSAARLPLVKRSIHYYTRQTFKSAELVIALDAGAESERRAIEDEVASLGRVDVRVVRAPGTPSLGRLRNFSIEQARGQLISVWDDDDIYHPARLEQQVDTLARSGAIGTFLGEVLQFFPTTGELFWTNYCNTVQKCHPATGLFRRSASARYPETGPESLRGEDTVFCLKLFAEGPIQLVQDAAPLYIYVSHGRNTSGDDHHAMLARSLGVSRARLTRRESVVREALDQADLPAQAVNVLGNNGLAFTWQPSP